MSSNDVVLTPLGNVSTTSPSGNYSTHHHGHHHHQSRHHVTHASSVLPILPEIESETPGVGSYVIDIGAAWTKVGVVGEYTLRLVEKTPTRVGELLVTGRDTTMIESVCRPFLEGFLLKGAGMLNCTKPCILLMNAAANPEFYSVVREIIVRLSSTGSHGHSHGSHHHSSTGTGSTPGPSSSGLAPSASGSTFDSKSSSALTPVVSLMDPAGLVINAQVASLWSVGAVTGFVIDIGHSSSRCVPVIRGSPIVGAQTFSKVGAKFLFEKAKSTTAAEFPQLDHHKMTPFLELEQIEEIFFQYGCVTQPERFPTPEHGDDSIRFMEATKVRSEALHLSYPAYVKTLTVGVKPNLALEYLFTEVDGEDSGATPLPLLLKQSLLLLLEGGAGSGSMGKTKDEDTSGLPAVYQQYLANSVLIVRGGMSDVPNVDQRLAVEILRAAKNETCTFKRRDEKGADLDDPKDQKSERNQRMASCYSRIPADSPLQKLLLSLKMPESRAPYGGSVCGAMGAMARYKK